MAEVGTEPRTPPSEVIDELYHGVNEVLPSMTDKRDVLSLIRFAWICLN